MLKVVCLLQKSVCHYHCGSPAFWEETVNGTHLCFDHLLRRGYTDNYMALSSPGVEDIDAFPKVLLHRYPLTEDHAVSSLLHGLKADLFAIDNHHRRTGYVDGSGDYAISRRHRDLRIVHIHIIQESGTLVGYGAVLNVYAAKMSDAYCDEHHDDHNEIAHL